MTVELKKKNTLKTLEGFTWFDWLKAIYFFSNMISNLYSENYDRDKEKETWNYLECQSDINRKTPQGLWKIK